MLLSEFQIRAATNQDIPFIKKVVFPSLREFGLSPDENGKDKDLNDIENNYLSNNGFFGVVVHTETNQMVGCFGLFPVNESVCELRKMYLLKESRGKGLGKFILNFAIRTAREKHYKKIILETIAVLTTAIALYKRYGFTEIKPKEINARVDQAFELDIEP
ncbi:MAG TPA: GNAT family N-acetyltransferase [Puia sp.]|nr:GNAT family N-acetyltransferase [Puia sp.]